MSKFLKISLILLAVLITVSGIYLFYGHFTNQHSDNNMSHQVLEKVLGETNECRENLKTLQKAADKYKADNGMYPKEIEELLGKYVKKMPRCPGGNGYSIDAQGVVFEDPNKGTH